MFVPNPGFVAAQQNAAPLDNYKARDAAALKALQNNLYGGTPNQRNIAARKTLHQAVDPLSAEQHVKNMQQFLKNRGYNITVDGIRGPQTNAVVAAFHNGIGASVFNAAHAPKARTNATVSNAAGGGGGGYTDIRTPKHPAGRKPSGVKTATVPAGKATNPLAIDPYKYATSAANAQYDPTINALQAQLANLDPQHKQNVADINSWIAQLQGDNDQAIKDTQAFDAKNLAGYDQSAGNIAQLFGGAAAPDFSGFVNIGRNELTGLSDSQNAFQKNMDAIFASQGADSLRQEQNVYQGNKQDLLGQLLSQRQAKGQAYTADLQTGLNNAQQAQVAQQALDLARGTQPYQIATAKAQAAAARAQAASAKADAANAGATAAANLKLINSKVQQAQAAAQAAKGGWNLTDPNDRGQLASAIRQSIGNQNGWFKVSPKIALSNIQQALVQAGLSNDPQAQQIADAVFQEVLNSSHSAKLFRNVQYVNGKLVVKPKSKK